MTGSTKVPEKPYLPSKDLDALARIQTELLSELWILRDRVLVLEHLLAEAGVVAADAIDAFEPPEALAAALRDDRDALVTRVVGAGHRTSIGLDKLRK